MDRTILRVLVAFASGVAAAPSLAGDEKAPAREAPAPAAIPAGTAKPTDAGAPGASRESALREYEERFVGFDEFAWVSGGRAGVSSTIRTVPYLGKYKQPLGDAEFYEVVGRGDLAAIYRERQSWRAALGIVGGALLVGGAVYTAVGFDQPLPDPSVGPEEFRRQVEAASRAQDRAFRTGLAISLSGLAAGAIALAIDPHPVAAFEARRLADEHNQRLRRELGLSAEAPAPSREDAAPAGPGARLSLGLGPTPGGGMAALAVVF